MLPRGSGSIFFTGATAGVKGFARSSVFAMGKFALRGLAQSLARELGPAGIHVVHFVIDGAVVQGIAFPVTANAFVGIFICVVPSSTACSSGNMGPGIAPRTAAIK
jgi:hypothetical protein